MQSARRLPAPVVLVLFIPFVEVMAAGAEDSAMPVPSDGDWMLLLVIGIIGLVVTIGILMYSLRLVKAFGESTTALIDALRSLTPMPVVSFAGEIPADAPGQLEVRISGFSTLPFGEVTVILAPAPGLALEEDHITLPRLDPGETEVFRIGHGRVRKGKYLVRITVLYRLGEEVRTGEFTRIVCAGNTERLVTVD